MTGVLKSAATGPVEAAQPFTGQTVPTSARQPVESATSESLVAKRQQKMWDSAPSSIELAKIAELQEQIQQLKKKLAEQSSNQAKYEEEAFEKGKQAGVGENENGANKRLEALTEALERATKEFAGKKGEVEVLSLQLAQAALEKLIAPDFIDSSFLKGSIAYQLERFAEQNPTKLRVSPIDFPDTAILDDLVAGKPGLALALDPTLKAGDCRIALELGEVDIGLPGQLGRLREMFEAWSESYAVHCAKRQPAGSAPEVGA